MKLVSISFIHHNNIFHGQWKDKRQFYCLPEWNYVCQMFKFSTNMKWTAWRKDIIGLAADCKLDTQVSGWHNYRKYDILTIIKCRLFIGPLDQQYQNSFILSNLTIPFILINLYNIFLLITLNEELFGASDLSSSCPLT